ncbi:MAG: Cof-type HAD-IIB family hydrolase [Solobacterium sp.]|nr:Cof-type HAD-IIB family hydrolase [Solobacterium sp.]
MKNMIKAIFFDIDGTLTDLKTRRMRPSTIEALNRLKEKGIYTFISSGRPVRLMIQESEVFQDVHFDGYVLLNGQYCTDENFKAFYKKPIKKEAIKKIIQVSKDKEYALRFFEDEYIYLNKEKKDEFIYIDMPIIDPRRALEKDTYQISGSIPEEDDSLYTKENEDIRIVRWAKGRADIIPFDGGKANGIQETIRHYGFHREEIMAFGDGENDIEMLEYAHIGIAMGNGHPNLLKIADEVCENLEEDGLYKALLRHKMI